MSKLLAFLMGALCLLWISAWTFWFKGETAGKRPPETPAKVSITLRDGAFHYTGLNVFHFNLSDAVAMIGEEDDSLFVAVTHHLNQHPQKELLLTGAYMTSERNNSRYVNLGIARAEAVKKLLLIAGSPPDRIKVEGSATNNLVQANGKLFNTISFRFREIMPPDTQNVTSEHEKPITINSRPNDAVVLRYPMQKFNLYDVGGRVVQILDSLRNHVMNRPEQKLVITGFSDMAEEAATTFNLAEYRAIAVRRYLVDTGMDRRQVVIRFEAGVDGSSSNRKVEMHVE